MKLSRKLASTLHVALILALGAALVPLLSSPALADSPIIQSGTGTGTTITTDSASFHDAITTTGGDGGTISFAAALPSTPPGVSVDSAGNVTTTGPLAAGTYTLTGTDSDLSGDIGSWSYALTVNGVQITQSAPLINASPVSPGGSGSFTDQLETNGISPVSFTQSSGTADLTISSSGAVTAAADLPIGDYEATGSDSDNYGDTAGSWSYTLDVTAGTITQSSPTENGSELTPADSSGFTDQLETTGAAGAVSYLQSVGLPEVSVSGSGLVTVGPTLSVGPHVASGTDIDSYGDEGTWTYTVNITNTGITQISPTSNPGPVTPAMSAAFTAQLTTNGNIGAATFLQATGAANLTVSSSGAITVVAPLSAPQNYTATGSDSDIYGDTGSWTYTLVVTPATLAQDSPPSNTAAVTPFTSTSFTTQLETSGGVGSISYSETPGSSELSVSPTGEITVVGQPLAVGSYTATGSESDTYGDTAGSWSFTLNVTPGTIVQSSPTGNGAQLLPAGTAAYSDQLDTTDGVATVSYLVTAPSVPPGLEVSSSGAVTTTGSLAAGSYVISGSDSDTDGDTGSWTYTLNVTGAAIAQSAPKTNSVTPDASASFSQKLTTSGNVGAVSFTTLSTSKPTGATTGLAVSLTGTVSTTGALVPGTYVASGDDTDSFGDSGTWGFTLTVTKTAITQTAPFLNPNKLTPATSSGFTSQLKTAGTPVKVTFVTKLASPPGLVVSDSGVVSTKGALAAGTYAVSGTDSDGVGDNGTWGFSVTVTPTKITQQSPGTAATTTGKAVAVQLKVTGSFGPVSFAESAGKPSLTISSKGIVSAPDNLKAGTYRAAGTVSDNYKDDRGNWTFSLTVTATRLAQAAPSIGATTTGKAFAGKLVISGSHGAVSFSQATGAPHLKVSASGSVTAPSDLTKGTYRASGTVSDALGDSGSWSFTLSVLSASMRQLAPSSGTTVVGRGFSGHLKLRGSIGKITYTQSTGAPRIKVSSSGAISAPPDLAKGTYKATGSARDTDDDSGTWSFTLTVAAKALLQLAPTKATTTTGTAFRTTLKLSGAHGRLTYSQSRGAPHLRVSSSGAVSASASLPAGNYKATGSASDSYGDSGGWSFVLIVSAHKLAQLAPLAAKIAAGSAYTAQITVSGAHGRLTYTQSVGAPRIVVSSAGALRAPADLAAGTYKASGSVRDSLGDLGAWSFELTVVASKLTQAAPDKATISTGKAFAGQLKVSGSHGTVVYTETKGAPHLKVSPSGAISAAASLPAGLYKATGTEKDSAGDTGKWSFSLTIKASGLTQLAPKSAKVTSGRPFTDQLKVSGARGKVTFTQLTDAQVMTVSPSGVISAPATLAPATYIVTGTAKDKLGDSCNWSFTLTVTP